MEEKKLTPMLKQYLSIKKEYPDTILLFRMGDFYEMFFEDAEIARNVLNIVLTSRSKGPDKVPMAGFPYHASKSYILRFIKAGYKVAICEQVEDPKHAKGLVDRDVIQVVTAGTITDEFMLDEKTNNYLVAVFPNENACGLAWADLSTGRFELEEIALSLLLSELERLSPSEILFPEHLIEEFKDLTTTITDTMQTMVTPVAPFLFDYDNAFITLTKHFGTHNLDGFGLADEKLGIISAGVVMDYLYKTQKENLHHINKLSKFTTSDTLILEGNTRVNLEIIRTIKTGQKQGSLLDIVDKTHTPMGARLLRDWLLAPLVNVSRIVRRQQGVSELNKDSLLQGKIVRQLKSVCDIERIAAKVSTAKANARDLIALAESLRVVGEIKDLLAHTTSPVMKDIAGMLDPLPQLQQLVENAICDDPPLALKDGGIIKQGYNAELDELHAIGKDGKSWIAKYQADQINATGINSLKVGFNKVFGYYIEVTNTYKDAVPDSYIRKQTLKNAERFITPELKEYENKVLSCEEKSKNLEYELFVQIRCDVAQYVPTLQKIARSIAELDALSSLSQVARENNYVKPQVDDSTTIDIKDGRHPVLEVSMGRSLFVPNDAYCNTTDSMILLITGPNMAGKSTYIRQVALIVILAQIGSFVPAKEAHIGVVDRIFTRVGASDEIARGQSTFMVEMTEASNILNNATERSLVVLDEIGRGTSTFDGVSIAWSIVEFIHNHLKNRTLFATHYHELTELALLLDGVKNYNVAVSEWGGKVNFLRRIVPGGTDKSYGIHVAKLAGIPDEVVHRANQILTKLESEYTATIKTGNVMEAGMPRAKHVPQQLALFAAAQDPVIKMLKEIDPNALSPMEALTLLHKLKEEIT